MQGSLVLAAVLALAACSAGKGAAPAPEREASAVCAGATGKPLRFRETTSNRLSGMDVGVADLMARDLADDGGAVAPRMSAALVIHDPDTDAITRATVSAGSMIAVGADRYCVLEVASGHDGPGAVSLVKLGS